MQAQTPLTKPVAGANESMATPHSPARVFLLSDCRLLREVFSRVLKDYPGISLAGAQEFLAVTAEELIESTCDVLLIDPVNVSAFDARILDKLQGRSHDLRMVIIDWDLGIFDFVSSIFTPKRSEDGFANEHCTGR